MTQAVRRMLLSFTVVLMLGMLVVFVLHPDIASDPRPPQNDARALAAWMAEHPADWKSAAALTSVALDSDLPNRFELWRASYAIGVRLAPRRTHAAAGFVRAGLFHWYELGPRDRAAVLSAAAPLLRSDVRLFDQLLRPLYQLTGDFAYLRRVVPRDIQTQTRLRDLAASIGRFDDYRALRDDVRRTRLSLFEEHRASATVYELMSYLPSPLHVEDEPVIRGVLEELDRRPFDPTHFNDQVEALTIYALDHNLRPLGGLTPLIASEAKLLRDETRLRLARASGDHAAASRIEISTNVLLAKPAQEGVWVGLCGENELCGAARGLQRTPLTLTFDTVQSDEIPPYVEIYVDEALAAEGDLRAPRTFTVGPPGAHRIELRVPNPVTRGGIQRRVSLKPAPKSAPKPAA